MVSNKYFILNLEHSAELCLKKGTTNLLTSKIFLKMYLKLNLIRKPSFQLTINLERNIWLIITKQTRILNKLA